MLPFSSLAGLLERAQFSRHAGSGQGQRVGSGAPTQTCSANSSASRWLSASARRQARSARPRCVVAVGLEVAAVGQLAAGQASAPTRERRQHDDVGQRRAGAVALLPGLVEPAGHDAALEMRVRAARPPRSHRRVVQVQVVVGDAAVPIRAARRAGHVVHGLRARTGSSSWPGSPEPGCCAVSAALRLRKSDSGNGNGSRGSPKTTRSSHAAQRAAACGVGDEGAQVAQRRAPSAFAPQQVAAMAGEHVQPEPRWRQHLGGARTPSRSSSLRPKIALTCAAVGARPGACS